MVDALAGFAIGGNELANVGKFLLQGTPVDIEGVLFEFVEHDENGGIAAKALDQVSPVLGIGIFVALATVEHQQVKATLGEKELVGGVHDLLPPEVPHVEFDVFRAIEAKGPLGNLNTLSFLGVWLKHLTNKTID